ncbi:MAG: ABC transporter substrate-binding protein [Clostridia bacterium]|nr:ABC transporter substrate-binding protein [Clostridia bacterium]MBQ4159131.1 ABC transporter substrate-binding protein [Clostridia bacterium]
MKKLLAILTVMVLCLSMMIAPAMAEEKVYKIGICQLVQHPALDAATLGFTETLKALLGDQVEINEQNASGEISNCITIVNALVADDVDLIMANATPAVQAAFAATEDIPILGTSVTDYGTALEIENWTGVSGYNVSGTSDLAPLDGQAQMIKELFPEAKTIGLLYCSSEPNSIYQVEVVKGYLADMGYATEEFAFTDSNDVYAVAMSACVKSDVIYIPTDNTAASCTEAIRNVVEPEGVPVVAGEEGLCAGCGVATLSISYYDLGCQTAKMAYEILVNDANIAEMPIEFAPNFTKKYNKELCEIFGISIPEGYVAIGE